MRKYLGCTVALLAALLLQGCKEEQAKTIEMIRPVKVTTVGGAELIQQGWLPGRARAGRTVDLSFRVGGPLVERAIEVGVVVKAGDMIARIDPTDFADTLRKQEGALNSAKAMLVRAEGEYTRELKIFKEDPGATSASAVARKEEAYQSALANQKANQAALSIAENQLAYTTLTAPISGTVVATYVENFETVNPGQRVARLLDNSRIKFDVNVPEKYIAYVPYTSDTKIVFDAFPGVEIPAAVTEIATEASRTTRTYKVTLEFDQVESIEILAGMAGRAEFTLNTEAISRQIGSFSVPESAVFADDSGQISYVWLLDQSSMTVSKRQVATQEASNYGIGISEGLSEGDVIVTAGVHFLKEGQKVRLLEETASK